MAKRLIETFHGRPLLDIASYGRQGPRRRDRLSPAEIDLIRRTVSRSPEVVVKVLTRGGQSLRAVRAHLAYLNRQGELEIETDHGERLSGKGVENRLVNDWDLDLEEWRRRSALRPGKDRAPPKLVHKVLFSMPAGTPPRKVLESVKNFAREEFALRHRYAMVLHTDEPHPHVHLVVKAVSEQGIRLNIRKETLRRWRSDFAAQLRQLDVAANATDRAARGSNQLRLSDGVFRTAQRGDSRIISQMVRSDHSSTEFRAAKAKVVETRELVTRGWAAVSNLLRDDGRHELAARAERFIQRMPPPRTDQELLTQAIVSDRDALIRSGPTR